MARRKSRKKSRPPSLAKRIAECLKEHPALSLDPKRWSSIGWTIADLMTQDYGEQAKHLTMPGLSMRVTRGGLWGARAILEDEGYAVCFEGVASRIDSIQVYSPGQEAPPEIAESHYQREMDGIKPRAVAVRDRLPEAYRERFPTDLLNGGLLSRTALKDAPVGTVELLP